MSDSTGSRFLRSTAASYLSLLARAGISFVAKMLMARLIIPEGHGVYEQALRIVTIAAAVRDLGLPYHLMRDERRPYGTVLAFTSLSGLGITLALALGAPAFGFLTPELPPVLRVFALWVLLDGLATVPRAFFERELRVGRVVGPEIWRTAVVAVVSVGLAWFGWGVWSFVVADLAAAALFAAQTWWRARGELPLHYERGILPDLLRQSRLLFSIWVVLQLVTYIDLFIIEVLTDTATVGYYSRAYGISFLVASIVAPRALLPALVQYRQDGPRFRDVFRLSTVLLLASQVVGGYFLFFNAEKVILILAGANWQPAVPLLRVLCFVPFFDVFNKVAGEVLKARNEDRLWLLTAVCNLASLVGFGIFFTRHYGAVGMAAANFLLLGNLLMIWRLGVIFRGALAGLAADLAYVYFMPLPAYLLVAALTEPDSWGRFAGSWVAAAVGAGLLLARFYQPFLRFYRLRREA